MAGGSQPLTSLAPGTSGFIASIELPVEKRGRLLELGLLMGTQVELVRFAPLGDPVEIKIRGYNLTLHRQEAERIWIKPA